MTPKSPPDQSLQEYLDAEADAYLRSLPLSHFMESIAQSTQRKITLESFDLIHLSRPAIQCFSELLIQYPRPRQKKPGKVVPDNFIVIHADEIDANKSFNMHTQPVGAFLVLEYVSEANGRKDYDDNFQKYQDDLRVPYYLLFEPDDQEMTLYKLGKKGYEKVSRNAAGRVAIPELELEAGLLDGWVRYWFRDKLVPLPGDLLKELHVAHEQLASAQEARHAAEKRAASAEAELARLREELAKRNQPG